MDSKYTEIQIIVKIIQNLSINPSFIELFENSGSGPVLFRVPAGTGPEFRCIPSIDVLGIQMFTHVGQEILFEFGDGGISFCTSSPFIADINCF